MDRDILIKSGLYNPKDNSYWCYLNKNVNGFPVPEFTRVSENYFKQFVYPMIKVV